MTHASIDLSLTVKPLLLLLLQGLVRCIGGVAMAAIMRRIAEEHRYVTGGFPDLTVWNPTTRKFKASFYKYYHLTRDFDRPNAFAVRLSSVHFGFTLVACAVKITTFHFGSIWHRYKKILIITNYSSIGEAAWQ